MVEAQTAQRVAQEEQKFEVMIGEERIKHYSDRMKEAELRMKLYKMKRELEEQQAISRIEKWAEEVEDAQEDLLELQLRDAETPEIAQKLQQELEQMETQERDQEEHDQAAMKATQKRIQQFEVDIEQTKAALETMTLQDGLDEMTAKEKVKKEHVYVEKVEKELKAQKLEDDMDEAKAAEKADELRAALGDAKAEKQQETKSKELKEAETEAGAAHWKIVHSDDVGLGDNYVPTILDNTNGTCDGSATFWGRKGKMAKSDSLEDCAKLCSAEVQCRFIQFQQSSGICHLYKDCENTRNCDNDCARTLERQIAGAVVSTPKPEESAETAGLFSMPSGDDLYWRA